MKNNLKASTTFLKKKSGGIPASGKAAKADATRRNSATNRSEHDGEDYDGRDFDNSDYNGKKFKDDDDYNSGVLGRAADVSDENNIRPIPKRKSKS